MGEQAGKPALPSFTIPCLVPISRSNSDRTIMLSCLLFWCQCIGRHNIQQGMSPPSPRSWLRRAGNCQGYSCLDSIPSVTAGAVMKNSARDTLALQHVLLLLATRMEGETLASRAPAVTEGIHQSYPCNLCNPWLNPPFDCRTCWQTAMIRLL